MTAAGEVPETIVFDAEPLVAYFCDEAGSDTVEAYVDAVMGSSEGYISTVTAAEVHYIVRAIEGEDRADSVVDVIKESGFRHVGTGETWRFAADFKYRHTPALGDAFALATAKSVEGSLLVGAAEDYDDITEIPIERFRVEPA